MSGCLLDIKMTENLVCVVSHKIRGWNVGEFCGQCFRFFDIIFLCFFVAISDLVHDVETIVHLC